MLFLKLLSLITLINFFTFNAYAEQCNAPELKSMSGFSCEQKWNYYHWLNIELNFIVAQQKVYTDAINGAINIQEDTSRALTLVSFAGGIIKGLKTGEFSQWKQSGSESDFWKMATSLFIDDAEAFAAVEKIELPYYVELALKVRSSAKCVQRDAIACAELLAQAVVEGYINLDLNDYARKLNNLTITSRYLTSYYTNGVVIQSVDDIAKEVFGKDCDWYDVFCSDWTSSYDKLKVNELVKFYSNLVSQKTKNSLITQSYSFPINLSSPTVFQSPIAAMQGRVTTLTQSGTGFSPNSLVEFHVKKPDGTEYDVQSVQTDSNGEFRIPYSSPANKAIGTYKWWVVDSKKGKSNEASYQILPANSTPQALHGYVGVTQLDPVEQPKIECLPDFVTTKSWLSNSSSKDSAHKVTFKAGEEAYAHGIIENQGCAKSPKDIKVMFFISKGEHEDAHDKWNKVGKKQNIKKDNLEVGATKHESTLFNVPNKSGKYNIVVCADRTKEQGNGDGDVVEKHKSNNCSTEAVFTVLPNPSVPVEEIKVNHKPEGSFESASCDTLAGWARDPDAIYPIEVQIYDDLKEKNKLVTSFKANAYRNMDDITSAHAFYIPTPVSLKDNLFHPLYMYAVDPEDGISYPIGFKALNPCDLPIRTKEFTISNTGNADLIVNSITPSIPAPWLTINPTSLKLSPTSSNKVVVKFDPKIVPDGQHVTYLNISSNDPEEANKMYPIKASGQGAIVDSDGDGYSDLIENEFNSNPNDPESTPVSFKCDPVIVNNNSTDITLNISNLAVFVDNNFRYFRTLFKLKPEYSYLDPTSTSWFFELEDIHEIYGDTCASATVSYSPDWKVHIPLALVGGKAYWGDFDFIHKPFADSEKIVVRLNKVGVYLK